MLLGGFELQQDGQSVALSQAARRIVAYLALHERPLARAHVAGVLWGEASDTKAGGSVRTALWRLRQPGLSVIESVDGALALSPDVAVDIREMRATARGILGGSREVLAGRVDLDLLAADLLPDWYEDWVMQERERLRQLRLHALEAACERFVQEGRLADAVEAGLCAVASEPLRESANLLLIKAYLAEGNRLEAVRHYRDFRQQLHTELGLDPAEPLEELVREVVGWSGSRVAAGVFDYADA
jgi:DNA-binding SARP family transcriptional activator